MVDVKVWRGSNGRLHAILPPGRLSPECVTQWFGILEQMRDPNPEAIVVHAEHLRSLDWNAASMLAGESVPSAVRAMAFVTGTSRDAADTLRLFTYFYNPQYEVRIFASRFLAVRWLASLETEIVPLRFPEFVPRLELYAAHYAQAASGQADPR